MVNCYPINLKAREVNSPRMPPSPSTTAELFLILATPDHSTSLSLSNSVKEHVSLS